MITADELRAERAASAVRSQARMREARARRLLDGHWNATPIELRTRMAEMWPVMELSERGQLLEVALQMQRCERPRKPAAEARLPISAPLVIAPPPAPEPDPEIPESTINPEPEDTMPKNSSAAASEKQDPKAVRPYQRSDNAWVKTEVRRYLQEHPNASISELRACARQSLGVEVPSSTMKYIRNGISATPRTPKAALPRRPGAVRTPAQREAAVPREDFVPSVEAPAPEPEPTEDKETSVEPSREEIIPVGPVQGPTGFGDLEIQALRFVGVDEEQLERAIDLIRFANLLPR